MKKFFAHYVKLTALHCICTPLNDLYVLRLLMSKMPASMLFLMGKIVLLLLALNWLQQIFRAL